MGRAMPVMTGFDKMLNLDLRLLCRDAMCFTRLPKRSSLSDFFGVYHRGGQTPFSETFKGSIDGAWINDYESRTTRI